MRLLDLNCTDCEAAAGYESAGFRTILGVSRVKPDGYRWLHLCCDPLAFVPRNSMALYDLVHATVDDANDPDIWAALLEDKGARYILQWSKDTCFHYLANWPACLSYVAATSHPRLSSTLPPGETAAVLGHRFAVLLRKEIDAEGDDE